MNNFTMIRYQRVGKLGEGGFAKVFLVRDTHAQNFKALKEIDMQRLSPESQAACRQEAEVLKMLDHPNIVKFYDVFNGNWSLCIVVEYCDGGDLQQKIISKTLIAEEIWSYFIQLCWALDYLHGNNIVHRDLKPANIFLTLNGEVKLADFNLSRSLTHTSEMANTFAGTLGYMSPEMLKRQPHNYKTDVWSLGCVLFWMVISSASGSFMHQEAMKFPYPPSLPTFTLVMMPLIDKLLEESPAARPSAGEILQMFGLQKPRL